MSKMKPSGISMARNVRLEILRRTREILSDPQNWTKSVLRMRDSDGRQRYCLVGAMERAAYDLKYADENEADSFDDSDWMDDGGGPLGYRIANEISIDTYANEQYSVERAFTYNDHHEHDEVLGFLDSYIAEVDAGRAREPQIEVEG